MAIISGGRDTDIHYPNVQASTANPQQLRPRDDDDFNDDVIVVYLVVGLLKVII